MAMQVDASPSIDPPGFLNCLGLQASDPRLTTLRTTFGNRSMLHYVASRLGPYNYVPRELDHQWVDFGVQLLKSGANAFSLGLQCDRLFDPNQRQTPFMACTGISLFSLWSTPQEGLWRKTLNSIRTWADMVHRAGIDLCQYGATEAELWKTLQATEPTCKPRSLEHSVVTEFVYGPTPAEWSLVIQYPPKEIGMFELQCVPGSFPPEQSLPTKVCWRPSAREEKEGPWKKTKCILISSPNINMENAISTREQEQQEEPFVEVAGDTQDDGGVIALLLLRSSRPRGSALRSHSQPSSLFRRKRAHGPNRSSPRFYCWLPAYHLCPTDYHWHVQWGHDDFQPPDSFCFQAATDEPFTAQKTTDWKERGFLALISSCQDGEYTFHRMGPYFGHTGLADCPWKCASVNLDKMHVPANLKPYHPKVEPVIF